MGIEGFFLGEGVEEQSHDVEMAFERRSTKKRPTVVVARVLPKHKTPSHGGTWAGERV